MGRTVQRVAAAGIALAALAGMSACTSSQRTASGSGSVAGSAGGSGPAATGSRSAGASASASKPAAGSSNAGKPAGSGAAPSTSGGQEGSGSGPEKCTVTSSAAVGTAFAATVAHESVGTSGIGSPLCTFTLSRSGSGAFGGVTATMITGYPASAFAQSKKSSTNAQPLAGLGSSAFYVPGTATVKVLDGSNALTVQYAGYLAGSNQPSPGQVRAALIALVKATLAQS